jgi:hypothetical protein
MHQNVYVFALASFATSSEVLEGSLSCLRAVDASFFVVWELRSRRRGHHLRLSEVPSCKVRFGIVSALISHERKLPNQHFGILAWLEFSKNCARQMKRDVSGPKHPFTATILSPSEAAELNHPECYSASSCVCTVLL